MKNVGFQTVALLAASLICYKRRDAENGELKQQKDSPAARLNKLKVAVKSITEKK